MAVHVTWRRQRPPSLQSLLAKGLTMIKQLKIIHLDDDFYSASLIQTLLAEEGLVCDIARVESEGDFRALLERGGFDLVLADLALPAISGMTALAMTRERYSDLPFIFVTDTMGEEIAIESLKSGATDCVMKSRLSRLAPAVQRALRETEEREKRRKAEEAQSKSEQLFRNAFENAVNGMCLTGPDGRFLTVNNSFCEMLGYSAKELATMTFTNLTHPDDLAPSQRLTEEMLTGVTPVWNLEIRYLHKDGRIIWALVSVFLQREKESPLYIVTQVQNITDLKNLENQLRHAQKMDAIGRLTGGIAHDFNNFLSVIMGHGSLLAKKLPDDGALANHLQQILIAVKRASQLTQSLLAFSRNQPIELRELNLNELITRVDRMISAAVRKDVKRMINHSREALTVMGDEGQLEQVLINLINNAMDAMPHGGVINIGTGIEEIDRKFVGIHGFGEPGCYAMLTVSDNGIGMDEVTRQKIFEPFFTTKEAGKGTGLGLSMAYGIVKQHRGFINCRSELGKGTTFEIYLPIAGVKPNIQR
jgi:PAS domain S-box-containing protein